MWSIGIYTGDSPYRLKPATHNPVLTRADVTDRSATFVADPFVIRHKNLWFMFFEVMTNTDRGEIAFATSENGFDWTYQQIILSEPFHLSYPYVFEWQGAHYMIPEALGSEAACLYKADDFPLRWSLEARLIEGPCADPSIFRFDDVWWMFVCSTPYQHDTLRLYFADRLTGPWREHPNSPVVKADKCRARPAGRVLTLNNKVIRFAQDCVPQYGTRVRAMNVLELNRRDYVELEHRDGPILEPRGNGWNARGMHHVDAHQQPDGKWLACVDGFCG